MKSGILLGLAVLSAPVFCRGADEPEYGGKPLSYWVRQLGDNKGRAQAIDAVMHIGSDAKSAVPKLAHLLETKVAFDRNEVVRKKKEEDDKKELERKKAAEKKTATTTKTVKTPPKNPADVKLEQEAKKRAEEEHKAAAAAVDGVNVRSVGTALLKTGNDDTGSRAAVTALLSALDTYDDLDGGRYRGEAVECVKILEQFGPNAKQAANSLVKLMSGGKGIELADAAANAIAKIAPENDSAQALLIKRIQDRDEKVAVAAMAALKKFGKAAKEAVPTLKAVKEKAGATTKIGVAADETIKAIEE